MFGNNHGKQTNLILYNELTVVSYWYDTRWIRTIEMHHGTLNNSYNIDKYICVYIYTCIMINQL